jgi:hypothetical protein
MNIHILPRTIYLTRVNLYKNKKQRFFEFDILAWRIRIKSISTYWW